MDELLGSKYQFVKLNGDGVVLVKGDNSDLVAQESSNYAYTDSKEEDANQQKTMDDYIFQVYVGSLTVVGLFILFRMIQKSS